MATFLDLVNSAVDESGCDLAQYATNGSDFATNTEPMLNKFKKYVARAWKEVQQKVFDWQFLNNQAVVTVNPGLMFYSKGDIQGSFPITIDVYGTDNAILQDGLPVDSITDLTYTQYSNTAEGSFGYINLTSSYENPLTNLAFKSGGDYFYLNGRLTKITQGANLNNFFYNAIVNGQTLNVVVSSNTVTTDAVAISGEVVIQELTPYSNDIFRGTTSFALITNNTTILDFVDTNDYSISLFNISLDSFDQATWSGTIDGVSPLVVVAYSGGEDAPVVELVDAKAYLHSWKSFNFSEEIADDDYQNEICEINNTSFQLIDHGSPSPSSSKILTYVPWEKFRAYSDWLCGQPGVPAYITEDNTGRWRLYPHPNQPVTLKFEFKRVPQKLVNADDTLKGIPEDFHDLAMFLAVRYYGEYDEQPSVARRAERYYKDLLQSLMIKYRPKFKLAAKRLY